MSKNEKITRRSLLRKVAWIISFPALLFWIKGIDRTKAISIKTKIVLPNNLQEGITFLDKVIIRKESKSIRVYSASCTHLGCKINSEKEKQLICPCHGSKFNFDGDPVVGPAVKPLRQLKLHKDKKSGEMIVYV